MLQNVTSFASRAGVVLLKHLPKILVGVGVALGPGVIVDVSVGGINGSSSLNKTCSTFSDTF